ncbi:MAG: hypothetical protein V5783_08415 [Pontiella sp.]
MKKLVVVALSLTVASGAFAAAFQASLTPDIALQDRETDIKGVSVGLWNENPSETFQWQFGFVNGSTGDSVGVQSWFPFPLPTLFNYAENYTGVQLGIVNYASGDLVGLQWGVVNHAANLTGVQLGLVNCSEMATGFQWGFVNYTKSARNLFQLGLVNIIQDNEWFSDFPNDLAKGFVFVNWSFGDE